MREIEIKLRVNNLEELENKLRDSGLAISKELEQHDTIYTNDPEIFNHAGKEGHIVMRIRKQNGISLLTLKQQLTYEMDNIEYETEIKDSEIMYNILLKLGWKPEVEVKKKRKKGKLGEYEICLDRVEQLGDFIEIEKMTDDNADPEKTREELFKELEKFGLSRNQEETKGYDTQIYQLKNKK